MHELLDPSSNEKEFSENLSIAIKIYMLNQFLQPVGSWLTGLSADKFLRKVRFLYFFQRNFLFFCILYKDFLSCFWYTLLHKSHIIKYPYKRRAVFSHRTSNHRISIQPCKVRDSNCKLFTNNTHTYSRKAQAFLSKQMLLDVAFSGMPQHIFTF